MSVLYPISGHIKEERRKWGSRDVDIAYDRFHMIQERREIETLSSLLSEKDPSVILEIGTYRGGDLFLFSRIGTAEKRLIGVDIRYDSLHNIRPKGENFDGYTLILGDSQERATVDRVRKELMGSSVDFLFIDGCHKTESVISDFDNYGRFMAEKSIVAFHDIKSCKGDHPTGPGLAWNQIKEGRDFVEILGSRKWGGIGVIFMP